MWTQSQRRQHKLTRSRAQGPTDLKDDERHLIESMLAARVTTGRPRKTDLQGLINALRYLPRTGCEWRVLPNDFSRWGSVYYWLRRLRRRPRFKTTDDLALMLGSFVGGAVGHNQNCRGR